MAELDDTLIHKAPKALKEFARKHNKLVKLIEEMEGRGGIKVTATKGRIIIHPTSNGPQPSPNPLNTTGGGGGSGTQLVTSVAGRTGDVTLSQADISGLTTGDSPTWAGATISGTTLTINGTAFTVQTLQVCVSGSTKTMYVLGTTPA